MEIVELKDPIEGHRADSQLIESDPREPKKIGGVVEGRCSAGRFYQIAIQKCGECRSAGLGDQRKRHVRQRARERGAEESRLCVARTEISDSVSIKIRNGGEIGIPECIAGGYPLAQEFRCNALILSKRDALKRNRLVGGGKPTRIIEKCGMCR